MITIRDYQKDAINCIRECFKQRTRQFIQMPTGSGKTFTFLHYAHEYHSKILIIVPSKELLNQVYTSSLMFYNPSEISRKGNRYEEEVTSSPKGIHICIINSIRVKYLEYLSKIDFDLIIIDEAHHSQANTYKNFLKIKERDFILGVTATPDRADGKLLREVLSECSFSLEIEDMIEKKYLCDIEGYTVKTNIDMSDVDDHNGDFSINLLYKKLNTEDRNRIIIDSVKNTLKDRKTLIFCINVAHSKQISKLLNENGIASRHIDGTMSDKERFSILSSFRNGEISCICNCQLLTEGFDEPSIDGIIIARPTNSRSLFTQMIGRGLRTFAGKENCKIVDIVDNHKNLSGFNSILTFDKFPEIVTFKSIKEIRDHIGKETVKLSEYFIERTDFLNRKRIDDEEITDSMRKYLEENKITFFDPISFNEGSFMIWFNELKKEYING